MCAALCCASQFWFILLRRGMVYIFSIFMIFSLKLSANELSLTQLQAKDLLSDQSVQINLKNAEKKGSVFVFMSAKCPCSNSHVQEIKKLSEKYAEFQFFAVHSNGDESAEMAQKYFKNLGFNFKTLQDENFALADLFKAFKTPHAFVIDPKGQIIYQGGVTNSSNAASADQFFLAEALKSLSKSEPIQVSNGRTLGCVILRK